MYKVMLLMLCIREAAKVHLFRRYDDHTNSCKLNHSNLEVSSTKPNYPVFILWRSGTRMIPAGIMVNHHTGESVHLARLGVKEVA